MVVKTSISADSGEPEALKEEIIRPNLHSWKISAIFEVNNFLSRKSWIPINRSILKEKRIKSLPVKWVFNSREDTDVLIRLKSRNVIKGYMQVPGVDYTESFSPVSIDTSTSNIIVLALYRKE